MWTFVQRTGDLRKDGQWIATGYSGHGEGKNAPELQDVHNVGPIPRGAWLIEGPPQDTAAHGPFVLRLTAQPGTETFGRAGFLMHGDMADPALRGTASTGCIIMPREVREMVWASGDRDLTVVQFDDTTPQVC